MKTKSGVKRIEDVRVGDQVLSRDEVTGKQDWKRVKQTFVTRPDHLVTLRYRPIKGSRARRGTSRSRSSAAGKDGSGSEGEPSHVPHGETGKREGWTATFALEGAERDSSLTGTAVHPFWSVDRQAWVDMGALRPGEQLRLSDGSVAVVTGMSWEFAKPGERFTTYNFEVEDWHTYFVRGDEDSSEWVWVHNECLVDAGIFASRVGPPAGARRRLFRRRLDLFLEGTIRKRLTSEIRGEVLAAQRPRTLQAQRRRLNTATNLEDIPTTSPSALFTQAEIQGMLSKNFGANDLALVATAIRHNLPIVTANPRLVGQVMGRQPLRGRGLRILVAGEDFNTATELRRLLANPTAGLIPN